jgi:hypothetical protein
MSYTIGSEVQFRHAITKKVIVSKVYDTCYQGDPSTWSVLVKVGDGSLIWQRCQDCQEVSV